MTTEFTIQDINGWELEGSEDIIFSQSPLENVKPKEAVKQPAKKWVPVKETRPIQPKTKRSKDNSDYIRLSTLLPFNCNKKPIRFAQESKMIPEPCLTANYAASYPILPVTLDLFKQLQESRLECPPKPMKKEHRFAKILQQSQQNINDRFHLPPLSLSASISVLGYIRRDTRLE